MPPFKLRIEIKKRKVRTLRSTQPNAINPNTVYSDKFSPIPLKSSCKYTKYIKDDKLKRAEISNILFEQIFYFFKQNIDKI